MATRTRYLGGTITTIILLLTWFSVSNHFDLEIDGDKNCFGTYEDPCEASFNITSDIVYYLYNKEAINLNFVPNVKESYICKKDGRYKSKIRLDREKYPCGVGYREFDFKSPLTSRYKYVEKFTRNKKHEYKLVVFKFNPKDLIKWGGGIFKEEIDPTFYGVEVNELQDCKTESYIYYEQEEYYPEVCLNTSGLGTDCSLSKEPVVRYVKKEGTRQVCKDIGFMIEDKILNYAKFGWKCYLNDFEICCKAPHQSALDYPHCNNKTGEYFVTYDIRDMQRKSFGQSKTKTIKRLEIE